MALGIILHSTRSPFRKPQRLSESGQHCMRIRGTVRDRVTAIGMPIPRIDGIRLQDEPTDILRLRFSTASNRYVCIAATGDPRACPGAAAAVR